MRKETAVFKEKKKNDQTLIRIKRKIECRNRKQQANSIVQKTEKKNQKFRNFQQYRTDYKNFDDFRNDREK